MLYISDILIPGGKMSISKLLTKRSKLSRQLKKSLSPFLLKGGLVQMKRLCGKKGCRCLKGKRHKSWYLPFEGKMIYLPPSSSKDAKIWSANYQRTEDIIHKITRINIKILRKKGNVKPW